MTDRGYPSRLSLRDAQRTTWWFVVIAVTSSPAIWPARGQEEASLPGTTAVDYRVHLDTVLQHDDGEYLWFHPRTAAVPSDDQATPPTVVMTLQKHLRVSDHYSGLYFMLTRDLGRTWTRPNLPSELDWQRDGNVNIAVADVTPCWAPAGRRIIAIGAQVRYSAEGAQLEDQPRAHQTAYTLLDPVTEKWTPWRRLEMPQEEAFTFARCACAQYLCEPGQSPTGEPADQFLLPLYIAKSASVPFEVTVARCHLVGDELKFVQHGNILQLPVVRGLCEPSLIHFQDRYYLTLRNDLAGYVTVSDNGLDYAAIKPWQFDDGQELGSYNTQQHWLAHGDGLFLVYTRRGTDNDHIMRHRAPLFIAQVDPQRLQVVRATERVLVPERGATLGNFGAAAITGGESWVTVAEGVWDDQARQRGAQGALFLARVLWQD